MIFPDLWIPYPVKASEATYGAKSVFAIPVPQSVAQELGAEDQYQEFEMFARPNVPKELVSILGKVMTGIDQTQLQEMFMADAAERQVVHRVFGMTKDELTHFLVRVAVVVLLVIVAFGSVMIVLLVKQTKRGINACKRKKTHYIRQNKDSLKYSNSRSAHKRLLSAPQREKGRRSRFRKIVRHPVGGIFVFFAENTTQRVVFGAPTTAKRTEIGLS